MARAWRVAQDVTSEPGVDAASGDANLHKLVARTVHDVKQLLDAGKFNVVVAKTMELVNATRKAIDSGPGGVDPAVREAAETHCDLAVALRAVHRRGHVARPGAR